MSPQLTLASAFSVLATAAFAVVTPASPTFAGEPAWCATAEADSADAAACTLAGMLERQFIYREQGERYARTLREAVARGRYRALNREAASLAMTRDLQAVAADGHLRVGLREGQRPSGASDTKGKAPFPVLEDAGWLAPGIGYMRINEFPDDADVTGKVAAFMHQHASDTALIFDLRTHHGGGIAQMDAILPWLYAEPTRLVTMETSWDVERELGSPVADTPSMRLLEDTTMARREHWVTPNGDSRLHDAKVYLLTGPRTASAAEHFALALKRTDRATLVGMPTRGANHFGGQVDLPGGFYAFVPVGRTFDPETGQDWEGDGIAPDIEVPTSQALERVLTDLGLSADEAARIDAAHRPTLDMAPRTS